MVEGARPRRPLNEQVAFIAGYSHTSTGYTNPRGALKTNGADRISGAGARA
jgi:hypothetical protein